MSQQLVDATGPSLATMAREPDAAKNMEIESLRALAISLVVFQHSFNYLTFWIPPWAQTIGAYFNLGQAGVDLFLAVSGYVIAKSFLPRFRAAGSSLAAWQEMLAFWVKRIFRLWPTVFLWVLIDIVLAAAFNTSGAFGALRTNIVDGIAALAQVANFHHALCAQPGACFGAPVYTLGPLWSLSLEEQFYIAFPILLYALYALKKLDYLVAVLAVVAVSQVFLTRPDGSLLLYIRTDALCGGIIIYLVSSWEGVQTLKAPLLQTALLTRIIVTLFMLLILTGVTGRVVSFNAGISAVIAVTFVMIAHFEAGWFALPGNSVFHLAVKWIAERSFSIYVIHCISIALTREIWWHLTSGATPNATFSFKFYVTWIALTMLFCELNWRYVEAPLRLKGRRIAARWFSSRPS